MLSDAEPPWAATLAALILLPLVSHTFELAVHLLRHTPKLAVSLMTSVLFTALSTLFHLYAMRHGVLVVRAGASSLAEDMHRMPRIVLGFIAAGPVALFRGLRSARFWPALLIAPDGHQSPCALEENRNQTFTRL